jgi:CheY-like chemotaxis protein
MPDQTTAAGSSSLPSAGRCEVCGRRRGDERAGSDRARLPRVIVGHGHESVAAEIASTLRAAGFAPVCVTDGPTVLWSVDPVMPLPACAVLLDVGVAGLLVFEVVERIRQEPLTTTLPIVLLASVHARGRYKRPARRLYGADAALDLPDELARLVVVVDDLRHNRRGAHERQPSPTSLLHVARHQLSDIATANEAALRRGTRRGDPFGELDEVVAAARRSFIGRGGAADEFDAEQTAFSIRLLARFRDRDVSHG